MLMCLCWALVLASCGGADGQAAQKRQEPLRVGFIVGNDKYTSKVEGKLVGIEPSLSQKIAERLGVPMVPVEFGEMDGIRAGLLDGTIDLAFGRFSDTSPEMQGINVSRPYGKCPLFFVTKKNDYTDTLSVVGGGVIGILPSVKSLSGQVPGITLVVAQDYEKMDEMARDILAGKIDLGLSSEREAMDALSDRIQIQEVLMGPKESYVAALPNNSPLMDTVNSVIGGFSAGEGPGQEEAK